MPGLVAGTHAVVWYLHNDMLLSNRAREAFSAATEVDEPIFVSAISLVELTYLVEKGRLPAAALQKLRVALSDPDSGLVIADVDLAVADALAQIPRESVPDFPDRVIAATERRRSAIIIPNESAAAGTLAIVHGDKSFTVTRLTDGKQAPHVQHLLALLK